MALINKIPYLYYKSIKEIDYDFLVSQNVSTLLFDLDNTIIPYNVEVIPSEIVNFLQSLEKRFKVIILTNNSIKRAQIACDGKFNCIAQARKPFGKGVKEALELAGSFPSETVLIGDQLQSDILCGNKFGLRTILVNPIDLSSDTIPTKINRFFEKNAIIKIQTKYPELYQKKIKLFHEYLEND